MLHTPPTGKMADQNVRNAGFGSSGIQAGSLASHMMSKEAKASGGGVHSGGPTATLQEMGMSNFFFSFVVLRFSEWGQTEFHPWMQACQVITSLLHSCFTLQDKRCGYLTACYVRDAREDVFCVCTYARVYIYIGGIHEIWDSVYLKFVLSLGTINNTESHASSKQPYTYAGTWSVYLHFL